MGKVHDQQQPVVFVAMLERLAAIGKKSAQSEIEKLQLFIDLEGKLQTVAVKGVRRSIIIVSVSCYHYILAFVPLRLH